MFITWSHSFPIFALKSILTIRSEVVECPNHFIYLGSLISSIKSAAVEIMRWIQKGCLALANFGHLWDQWNIYLPNKGRVHFPVASFVLLHNCKTWPMEREGIGRYWVFGYRFRRAFTSVYWEHEVILELNILGFLLVLMSVVTRWIKLTKAYIRCYVITKATVLDLNMFSLESSSSKVLRNKFMLIRTFTDFLTQENIFHI